MQGQQKVSIREQKPSKFIELNGGYEMISNDSTIKVILKHISIMNGAMESSFYSTEIWIMEDGGWVKGNNSQNYQTKEEFISALSASEDFTQAMRDYELSKR